MLPPLVLATGKHPDAQNENLPIPQFQRRLAKHRFANTSHRRNNCGWFTNVAKTLNTRPCSTNGFMISRCASSHSDDGSGATRGSSRRGMAVAPWAANGPSYPGIGAAISPRWARGKFRLPVCRLTVDVRFTALYRRQHDLSPRHPPRTGHRQPAAAGRRTLGFSHRPTRHPHQPHHHARRAHAASRCRASRFASQPVRRSHRRRQLPRQTHAGNAQGVGPAAARALRLGRADDSLPRLAPPLARRRGRSARTGPFAGVGQGPAAPRHRSRRSGNAGWPRVQPPSP